MTIGKLDKIIWGTIGIALLAGFICPPTKAIYTNYMTKKVAESAGLVKTVNDYEGEYDIKSVATNSSGDYVIIYTEKSKQLTIPKDFVDGLNENYSNKTSGNCFKGPIM